LLPAIAGGQWREAKTGYEAGAVPPAAAAYSCPSPTSDHDGMVDQTVMSTDMYCDPGGGYSCQKMILSANSHIYFYKVKAVCSAPNGSGSVDIFTDSSGPSAQVSWSSASVTGIGSTGYPYAASVYTSATLDPPLALSSGTYWVCFHKVDQCIVAQHWQSGPDYCGGSVGEKTTIGAFGCTP
jgi:hypothetical protein